MLGFQGVRVQSSGFRTISWGSSSGLCVEKFIEHACCRGFTAGFSHVS